MAGPPSFDYFYGGEAEQYSFYRIPRALIVGERFKWVSTDAKLLYGLMLDRMGLSFKNNWLDDRSRVYIYFSLEDIQTSMNCAQQKACKLLAELDTSKGVGLIERIKQGQGKPARIYVKRFCTREDRPAPEPPGPGTDSPDFRKTEVKTDPSIYPPALRWTAWMGWMDMTRARASKGRLATPNWSWNTGPKPWMSWWSC